MDNVWNILESYEEILTPNHKNLFLLNRMYDFLYNHSKLQQSLQVHQQYDYTEIAQLFKIICYMKQERYILLIIKHLIQKIKQYIQYTNTKHISGYYCTKDICIPDQKTQHKQMLRKYFMNNFINNLIKEKNNVKH